MPEDTNNKTYGYIRISSTKQKNNSSLETQRQYIRNLGIGDENIYEEISSSKKNKLPEKKKLLRILKTNDSLYVMTPCRIGRDFLAVERELIDLTTRGILLYFGGMLITSEDPQIVFTRRLQLLLSWYENTIRGSKARVGIQVKREKQKDWHPGRPGRLEKSTKFKEKLIRHLNTKNPDGSFSLSKKSIAVAIKVSISSIYRHYSVLYSEGLVLKRGTDL